MTKPFSKDLYKKNDNAKHLVIDWLDTQGYDAYVNPDDYGIDLIGTHRSSGIKYGFEVEVKHNWKESTFPFSSVHFPERKLKFAKGRTYFVMLNSKRTHALIVKGHIVANSPIVSKTTKYTASEKFIEIDASKCTICSLEGLDGK